MKPQKVSEYVLTLVWFLGEQQVSDIRFQLSLALANIRQTEKIKEHAEVRNFNWEVTKTEIIADCALKIGPSTVY